MEPRWLVLVPREGGPVADLAASSGPAILAVGAEGPGVSKQVLELEHTEITIPLTGQVESLNSTVAAAIALYELRRSQVNP